MLLDEFGRAFLDDQHRAFAGAEILHLVRHQRIGDIEYIDRNARSAVKIGKIEARQRAKQPVGQSAENDDADLADVAGDQLVELLLADEFLRGRQALFDFQPLLREDDRRMREPAVFEPRRSLEAVLAAIGAALVILGDEFAGDVAGAHAQIQHDRRMACLGKLKSLLDHADDGRQIGARVDQPDRGFHGIGVGAFLDDAGALAVILAEHDQRAADDAGRRQIGQRVGSDIGADDRFPRHRAAQRIIDRGAEHGGGGGFVGAGLDVHAEIGQQIFGIHHDVEQVRDRRALIAADIADARLQQRLGDGEDALAAKRLAGAEPQRIHFFLERAFHPCFQTRRFAAHIYPLLRKPTKRALLPRHAGGDSPWCGAPARLGCR